MTTLGFQLQNSENVSIFGDNPFPSFIDRKLDFSNNLKVNLDFENYINLSGSNRLVYRLKLVKLLNMINSNSMVFYTEDDHKEIKNFINSFQKIKKFVKKLYSIKHKKNKKYVNDASLLFVPFDEINNKIELPIGENVYRFSCSDIIQIYNHSIKHLDEKPYINSEIESPKNPYTGIEFTLREHIIIYTQLVDYYKKDGKAVPSFISNLKECYFDTKKYFNKYYFYIMNRSVRSYLEGINDNTFEDEFNEMIESSFRLEKYYCKKCYSRINIRELFLDTVKLFILNSNEIYVFGNFEKNFIDVAKANDILFEDNHKTMFHRKRIRARRTRFRSTRNRTSSSNFPITTSNYVFNVSNNNVSFSQDNVSIFNINEWTTNISNTGLFNFNQNNNLFSNRDNTISFTFTPPERTEQYSFIDDSLSNLTIRIPRFNIESENSVENDVHDYEINLTDSVSSIDTPTNSNSTPEDSEISPSVSDIQ